MSARPVTAFLAGLAASDDAPKERMRAFTVLLDAIQAAQADALKGWPRNTSEWSLDADKRDGFSDRRGPTGFTLVFTDRWHAFHLAVEFDDFAASARAAKITYERIPMTVATAPVWETTERHQPVESDEAAARLVGHWVRRRAGGFSHYGPEMPRRFVTTLEQRLSQG